MECGVMNGNKYLILTESITHRSHSRQDFVSLECGVNENTAKLNFSAIVSRGVRREHGT